MRYRERLGKGIETEESGGGDATKTGRVKLLLFCKHFVNDLSQGSLNTLLNVSEL